MLNAKNTGIIVVDIQGKLARIVDNSQATIAACKNLINAGQELGLPLVWLEQNPEKLGQTVPEIRKELLPNKPIAKTSFNGCAEPQFMEAVEHAQKSAWLVCGIEAHICVFQTATQLQQHGYQVHVLADCIASRHPHNKQIALERLASNGITISSLEMSLFELVADCRSPAFKPILNLIK
ncbi:isochorismatase family protein [Halioxenophilus aromaticivorans]|uniref:Hydrolase n=1 Tax=Halioxenophilus aromaticivorans TaxID=1306992 RepID=A0AAV3TXG8_9ALTE